MAIDASSIKNLKPQYKMVMAVVVMAAFAGGFYYINIMDIDQQVAAQRTQFQKAEKELKEFEKLSIDKGLEELEKDATAVQKKAEENERLVPKTLEKEALMDSINQDARNAGLKVVSAASPKQEVVYDSYIGWPIAYEVEGSFPSILKFLASISQPEKRLVTVSAIKMGVNMKAAAKRATQKKKGDLAGKADQLMIPVSAKFNIEGYAYKAPPPPAPAPEQKPAPDAKPAEKK